MKNSDGKKFKNKLNPNGVLYLAVKEKRKVEEEIATENDYGYEYERFFSYFTLDEINMDTINTYKVFFFKKNLN